MIITCYILVGLLVLFFILADQTNAWGFDDFVKAEVKKAIPIAVDKLISECLEDHAGIKNKVIEKIEKAMTAKVQAALKMKAQA